MVVAMDAMAVAIHIKYALNQNCHLIPTHAYNFLNSLIFAVLEHRLIQV